MLSVHGFFDTLIFLGAIQGFIVGFLLLFSTKLKLPNRLLATLIFTIALASLNLYLINAHFLDTSRIFRLISDFVPLVIIMPAGPLIFFYVKSILDPGFVLSKDHRPHFYPVIIDLVPQVTAIIYVIGTIIGIIRRNNQAWGNFVDTFNVYADIPRWISITVYLSLSAKLILSEKNKSKIISPGMSRNLKWLHQFIIVFLIFQAIWLLYLVPYVIPSYTDKLLSLVNWYPIYLPLTIIVYWLGIKGLLFDRHNPDSLRKTGTYGSTFPALMAERTISILVKSMEIDKLYLQPALCVENVAKHTAMSPKIISAVLNRHLHKSFNDFVNEYRIEAFKEKVIRPDFDHLTIAGIALECGFNSQATFQRTFKQVTGRSPSAFRKSAFPIQ
jgi:AraC-like DNA-binding protein